MRICLYSDHSILAENRLAHTRETEFNMPDGTRQSQNTPQNTQNVSKLHIRRQSEVSQYTSPTKILNQWGGL